MKYRQIGVIGGTGFVGGHLIGRLARQGYRVRVLTRRREDHRHLLVLPTVELVEADVHDQAALSAQLAGCDAVINLAGVLNENGTNRTYEAVHVALPGKIVAACRQNGIKRLLHMSALNANANADGGASQYLRSKGKGEALVHAAEDLEVTSFRPSVIFGLGDSFFNRFASLLRFAPLMPVAGANAKFQPVYVADVAEAFVAALEHKDSIGRRYDLVGPKVYTLKELVRFTAQQVGSHSVVYGMCNLGASMLAAVMQFIPGKPLTPDNLRSMSQDSVSSQPFPFGIQPQSVEAIVPRYLGVRERQQQYQGFRREAGRDQEG